MTRYETGTRAEVIADLIRCAIQDREALICAHTKYNAMTGKTELVATDSEETVAECEAAIRDFMKISKVLR
jgi:metal-responsive CopG/Arc/MetJ family transcriptional regulator